MCVLFFRGCLFVVIVVTGSLSAWSVTQGWLANKPGDLPLLASPALRLKPLASFLPFFLMCIPDVELRSLSVLSAELTSPS